MIYFLPIFLGTFVLEDVALASSLALVAQAKMTALQAFAACFLGISLGDIGLYILGALGAKFGARFEWLKNIRKSLLEFKKSDALTSAIFISRFIPGTRLPTYLGAGFVRYSFLKFCVLSILSVGVWVGGALLVGHSIRGLLMDHWFVIIVVFLLGLQTLKFLVPRWSDPWRRKSLRSSWRQWLSFEFWPAPLFYLPIVLVYIYLSLKHRSFLTPFYASPHVANGGLIGESKWEFLKYLSPTDSETLACLLLPGDIDFTTAKATLDAAGFTYPMIMKPDVGQRGFAVRILRNDFDLTEYLLQSDFDKIAQRLSTRPMEAGLFYIRKPSEKNGQLFSITDKRFPFVTGDGLTRLGDLILQDSRARIIASVYFSRLYDELDKIPRANEKIQLSECGNHCQGAIFLDGRQLIAEPLRARVDAIAKQIPDFYFGRLDVRYEDHDSLVQGRNFEIVEINGSGSEATHIWDANTKLIDAYRTLLRQWTLLFAIGAEMRLRLAKAVRINVPKFLRECLRVSRRNVKLSVSS